MDARLAHAFPPFLKSGRKADSGSAGIGPDGRERVMPPGEATPGTRPNSRSIARRAITAFGTPVEALFALNALSRSSGNRRVKAMQAMVSRGIGWYLLNLIFGKIR
jgi:hypothetical protein